MDIPGTLKLAKRLIRHSLIKLGVNNFIFLIPGNGHDGIKILTTIFTNNVLDKFCIIVTQFFNIPFVSFENS